MKLFAGKSPTERNKIIAAGVLGVLSLFSLYLAFGGSIFSRKTTVTASSSPTPRPSASPNSTGGNDTAMVTADEMNNIYSSIPVAYPGSVYAPDPGRNIFAFYEPPPPTPYSPTPVPIVTPKTPTPPPPTPTPEFVLAFVAPSNVYAGAKGFRLELAGERFTPASRIYFNGIELPTTFISAERLVADVPANLIAAEGQKQIIVQTPDGKFYSNQFLLNVQAPPKPQLRYIGMIARKHYNNDTAYFEEDGKKDPIGARLNDVVGGRFRVVSISASEIVMEDVNLGFQHKLALYRPPPGQTTAGGSQQQQPGGRRNQNQTFPPQGFPPSGTYVPYTQPVPNQNMPNMPTNQNNMQTQEIPGIPSNIQRYVPPPNQPQKQRQDDVDDDGDGN